MIDDSGREYLRLGSAAENALVEGARSSAAVSGLTHCFYKYPARSSPKFVRAAIEVFTRVGDTVFDPFMGGGTSLVDKVLQLVTPHSLVGV